MALIRGNEIQGLMISAFGADGPADALMVAILKYLGRQGELAPGNGFSLRDLRS